MPDSERNEMDNLRPTERLPESKWPPRLINWCARYYGTRHGDVLHVDYPVTVRLRTGTVRSYYKVTFSRWPDDVVHLGERAHGGYIKLEMGPGDKVLNAESTLKDGFEVPKAGSPSRDQDELEARAAGGDPDLAGESSLGIREQLYRDEIIEQLYNLDRKDLRRIAWEALLMSDGPDHISGDIDSSAIRVTMTRAKSGVGLRRTGVSERFWFAVSEARTGGAPRQRNSNVQKEVSSKQGGASSYISD